MYRTKISPPFRRISKYLFLILIIYAFLIILARILGEQLFVFINKTLPSLLGNVVLIWWIIFLVTVFLEFINFLLMDNKKHLMKKEEVEKYGEYPSYSDKSLVMIPALNEEKTIVKAISIAKNVGPVLVIDDGSKDKTLTLANEHADHVISHRSNLGLASAIKSGIFYGLKRNYEEFIIFDADCQYTQNDLIDLAKIIRNSQFGLVMGSRLEGTIEHMSIIKKIGNRIFSKIITYLTQVPISDGQTGLRGFTSNFARSIDLRGNFTYTQEMLFEAARLGYGVTEFPITFQKREYGESRLMSSPINYATRAWVLNIQILAEYNPLKFTLTIVAITIIITFISLNENIVPSTNLIVIISSLTIMFQIGVYASIIIRQNQDILKPVTFIEIKP